MCTKFSERELRGLGRARPLAELSLARIKLLTDEEALVP